MEVVGDVTPVDKYPPSEVRELKESETAEEGGSEVESSELNLCRFLDRGLVVVAVSKPLKVAVVRLGVGAAKSESRSADANGRASSGDENNCVRCLTENGPGN